MSASAECDRCASQFASGGQQIYASGYHLQLCPACSLDLRLWWYGGMAEAFHDLQPTDLQPTGGPNE